MRILHVVPTYVPAWRHGGPVVAIHGLARAQAALGHAVTVFTTNVNGPERLNVRLDAAIDVDGVSVRYFPVARPRRYYRSPVMRDALTRAVSSFDVVHAHSLFLDPPVLAGRAALTAGVPYLVAPRGMLVKDLFRRQGRLRKSLWLRVFGTNLLKNAAALHVETELEAREARGFAMMLPPVHVVANGIDLEETESGPSSELSVAVRRVLESGRYVLYLGRISWKKGVDRLIEAMQHVPGVPLMVVGNDDEGLQPRLEALARRCGVADRVIFAGPVWGSAKSSLLRSAVCVALPSYSENFGNVVLEAMAGGIPAVVTPEVGLADEVQASRTGLVVGASPVDFGRAITHLLGNPSVRVSMGERGRAVAREKYAWPVVARQMLDVYDEAIDQAKRRRSGPVPVA